LRRLDNAGAAAPGQHLQMGVPRILTLGGHGFGPRPADRAIVELLLRLASERAPGRRPRIGLLSPDEPLGPEAARFRRAFAERPCKASVLSPAGFAGRREQLRDPLLAQDLIYVAGGDLLDLLASWEAHDLPAILALAWRRGVVLAGRGAGAMCWFEAGMAEPSGWPQPAAGLGLLGGSLCVPDGGGPEWRDAYVDAVAGGLPGGYVLDDHAGLIWGGAPLPTAVTAQRGARAWRVSASPDGVAESPLPARLLAAPAPVALREDIAEYRAVRALRRGAAWRR
jgi:dipeptidase E